MDIKQLCDRYHLKSRQGLYDRLKALGIELKKDGNNSYANDEQLKALDELHEHLANGGRLKNFTPILNTTVETVNSTLDNSLDTVNPILDNNTLTLALVDFLSNLTVKSPLDHHRDLEEAALKNWILSSGEIEKLLGVKPKGENFQRGFRLFQKSGRIGGQTAWKVSKIP